MLVSPFTFYRGAAMIMASDLATAPVSGLRVQCCGDAHLSNFGVFASPERRLVFDINDFDETLPGPWEWDVKRLCTSMLIAARDNSFAVKDQDKIVLDTVAGYRTAMREFAGMQNLAVWYARLEIESVLAQYASQFTHQQVKRTEAALAKARTKDSMSAFAKLCQPANGTVEIVDESPLIVPLRALLKDDAEAADWFERLRKLVRTSARRSNTTVGSCSSSMSWRISPARWSALAASGRGHGSPCSSDATTAIRCSCR